MGVDYLLTKRSTADEVRAETKKLIKLCGPGGRFFIGPVHDHPDMDMTKVKVMLETVWEHGKYPIGGRDTPSRTSLWGAAKQSP